MRDHESVRLDILKKQARRELTALAIGGTLVVMMFSTIAGAAYIAFHFITKFW